MPFIMLSRCCPIELGVYELQKAGNSVPVYNTEIRLLIEKLFYTKIIPRALYGYSTYIFFLLLIGMATSTLL